MQRLISSPGDIAACIARFPHGETRTIDRLRNDLARKAGVLAMCPVTTAITLKVVAEVALRDLDEGKRPDEVVSLWPLVARDSRLSCGCDHVAHLAALDAAAES